MQLSQKQKTFSEIFLHFQELNLILNRSQKKMTLIGDAFPEIAAPKNMVR